MYPSALVELLLELLCVKDKSTARPSVHCPSSYIFSIMSIPLASISFLSRDRYF